MHWAECYFLLVAYSSNVFILISKQCHNATVYVTEGQGDRDIHYDI